MARSSLAFQTIRNQAPNRLAENEVRSIHGCATHRVKEYKEQYWEALHKIMIKKFGDDYLLKSNNVLIFPELEVKNQSILTDGKVKNYIELKSVPAISQNIYSKSSSIPNNKSKNQSIFSDRKEEIAETSVVSQESNSKDIDAPNEKSKKISQKEDQVKVSFDFAVVGQSILLLVKNLLKNWFDLLLNTTSNPILIFNLILIGAFTSILAYLQKDFYIAAEGKTENTALAISLLCELALIVLVLIKTSGILSWLKNITLGILFTYVACCLGFTVWQSSTEEISNVQASTFSQNELDRLKASVLNAENAQKKVGSRDGATAMENARKSVDIAQNRLDTYIQTHPKISKSVQNLKEMNVLFQGVLLVLLRLIFMGVNAVLAHNLRNIWDRRDMKLA